MKTISVVRFLFKVGLLAAVYHAVSGKPEGAPQKSCPAMDPGYMNTGHLAGGETNKASGSASNVKFTGSLTVAPGGKLDMKLAGDDKFKGFFIQVRSKKETPEALGSFEVPNGAQAKVMDCRNGKNNAVSHNDPSPKKDVTVKWTAPRDVKGDYVVVYTIVKEPLEYWVKETQQLRIEGDPAPVSGASESGASLFVGAVSIAFSSVMVFIHL